MTEIACSSEDSSSSSSSCLQQNNTSSKRGSGAPFGEQQQQQFHQLPIFSSPSNQQQQQQPMKSPSSSSSGPKRPKFLQKLDIAPRELQSLSQVSVVKLSSNLNGSTTTTRSSGFNSSAVSPSLSVVSSSATNSPHNQKDSNQQQQSNNKETIQINQQQQEMNPLLATAGVSGEIQTEKRAWSDSSIGSSASAVSSPQVSSQDGTPQFKFEEQQQQTQQQQKTVSNTTTTSSSLQFTASLVHPNIYLGSAVDALHAAELIARGIFYILNVAYECDFSDSVSAESRLQKKKIDLRDSVQENIERAFEDAFAFIDEAISKGVKILVHCFVGSSRSATIVIGYLMKKLFSNQQHQQLCFEASKKSIIEQHQEQDRNRTLVSSPTMTIESLKMVTSGKQQNQQQYQHAFDFAPTTTATTTNLGEADDDPFASASEFINDFDIVSSSSFVAQQQSQTQTQQQQHVVSFYQSALEQVQKIRPEVLPNLAFSFALQKMDNQLLLRVSA